MKKMTIFVVIWLAVSPPMHSQEDARQALRSACMEACLRERPNADLQRQEVIVLEKEAVRAVLLGDATFFRRVYSDDFSGVLSRGEVVDRTSLLRQCSRHRSSMNHSRPRMLRCGYIVTWPWPPARGRCGPCSGQPVTSQMRACMCICTRAAAIACYWPNDHAAPAH